MNRLSKLALAVCGAVLLSMAPAVAAAQPGTVPSLPSAEVVTDPSAAAVFWIANANSRQCLLVRGGADLAPAVQFTCANFADQRWQLVGSQLRNVNSGKCLLVRGNADLAPAVQITCANFADQYWQLIPKGNGLYQLRNVNSGKCLLVRGNASLAPAVQITCANFADQYWAFLV